MLKNGADDKILQFIDYANILLDMNSEMPESTSSVSVSHASNVDIESLVKAQDLVTKDIDDNVTGAADVITASQRQLNEDVFTVAEKLTPEELKKELEPHPTEIVTRVPGIFVGTNGLKRMALAATMLTVLIMCVGTYLAIAFATEWKFEINF
uniref:Uncharacterized protein n=1 Tax=Panagrolaimus sp. JU765 TaxID=591449 RepID=A0AC34QNN4_9BILA